RRVGGVADADERVEPVGRIDDQLREYQDRGRVVRADFRPGRARHGESDAQQRQREITQPSTARLRCAPAWRTHGPSGRKMRSVVGRVPRSKTLNAARAVPLSSVWYSSNTPTMPELAAAEVRKKLWAKRVCRVEMRKMLAASRRKKLRQHSMPVLPEKRDSNSLKTMNCTWTCVGTWCS